MRIGYVPETYSQENYAQKLAPYLDAGFRHVASIKRILTQGSSPIPVVEVSILRNDATVYGAVTEQDVIALMGSVIPASSVFAAAGENSSIGSVGVVSPPIAKPNDQQTPAPNQLRRSSNSSLFWALVILVAIILIAAVFKH